MKWMPGDYLMGSMKGWVGYTTVTDCSNDSNQNGTKKNV